MATDTKTEPKKTRKRRSNNTNQSAGGVSTDGQLGQDDIVITDPDTYKLVEDWYRRQQTLVSLSVSKAVKARDDAKASLLEKMTFDDDQVQRYRFQLDGEADAMVFTLKATPPKEKESSIHTTRHNTHRLKLDIAE